MNNRALTAMNFSKYQLDFLWYSYFGIPKIGDDVNDEHRHAALITCIHRAYRDANRKMEYFFSEADVKKNNQMDRESVDTFKHLKKRFSPSTATKKKEPDAVKLIMEHISVLLSESNDDYSKAAFDNWHKGACTCIKEFAEDLAEKDVSLFKEKSFPYGLAQKWINMTLKYMLIMGFWKDELNMKAQYFHAPIDSNIIMEVKKKWNGKLTEFWTDKHWYELDDYCEYFKFQTLIRDNLTDMSPIEWENTVWIEQAFTAQ